MTKKTPTLSYEEAAEMTKIHAEFGYNTILQNEITPLYDKHAKPKAAAKQANTNTTSNATSKTAAQKPVIGAIEAEKIASRTAETAKSVEELKTLLLNFEGCESLTKTATQLVFSDGIADAPVMVIGEAPGAEEDLQGKPFVGKSGQLLDVMLSHIGLYRDKNFYITNTVFWRPPGNRTPTDAETNICAPFVKRHIELIAPQVILLVGNVSVKRFFETSIGITKLRGQWREYQIAPNSTIPMTATFHPAYLLRNPIAKKDVWRDLCGLKNKLIELNIQI